MFSSEMVRSFKIPDVLNISSISFIIIFHMLHLKNKCSKFSNLFLSRHRWHFPSDKFIFCRRHSVYIMLWIHFHWNSLILLWILICFKKDHISFHSIFRSKTCSHLIWHFGSVLIVKQSLMFLILSPLGPIVFPSLSTKCKSLSIFNLKLFLSGTFRFPFKIFRNSLGIAFFSLEYSEIQFRLSLNKLKIISQFLKFLFSVSQMSFKVLILFF